MLDAYPTEDDMPEDLANELLYVIDFFNNKVKSRKIEGIFLKLMEMVEGEMESIA